MKRLLVIVSFIAVIGLGVWFGLRAPEREAAPRPDVTTVTLSPPPAAQSQPLVLPSFLDLPIDALETGDQDEPSMPVDAPVETFVRAEELSGPQVRQEAKADSEMGGDQGLLLRNRYNQLKSGDVVVADTAPNDRDLGPGAGKERLGHRAQPPADDGLTGEAYAARADNPFMRVSEPGGDASTFAVDVDTASYSNVRRYLTQNRQRPPAAAVRIEEMINYFDYDYPAPTARDAHPFRFATAVAACPWAESHRLVRVALQGRVLDRSTRPALNLVFLVDTSGSMRGANRLPLVLRGLELLVEQLDERDHVAIVTYAGSAGTALAATSGADQARIRDVIRGLTAGGSTNGGGGINAAYDQAALHAGAGVQSRVVLCTDGDFNVGVTSQDQLKHLIEAKRASGVFLSVYGFGMGNLKDQTLEMLANTGNGVYGYIDDERELRKVMIDEALGALVTIAKDVKIQVFFNPTEVAGWRLIGFENRLLRRKDFTNDRIDAGDIGAGHTVTALYEVVPAGMAVPSAVGSDPNPFTERDHGQLSVAPGTLMRVRLRYKQPDGETSTLIESDVAARTQAMDDDFHLAAAVAGFGMLLRESPYQGACTWDLVQRLAVAGAARDPRGLRAEFLGLIRRARSP